MPLHGVEEWDRPGEPLHDPEGLAAFTDEFRKALAPTVQLREVQAHINDSEFTDAVLAVLDGWIAAGIVTKGEPNPA